MNDVVTQEYLHGLSDELEYFTREAARELNQFKKGEARLSSVKSKTEKAAQKYQELMNTLEEHSEEIEERGIDHELQHVEAAGYDEPADIVLCNDPLKATNGDPKKEALDNILNEDIIELDRSFEVMDGYKEFEIMLTTDYGIDDIEYVDESGALEEFQEDLGRVEEIAEQNDVSQEEAIGQLEI